MAGPLKHVLWTSVGAAAFLTAWTPVLAQSAPAAADEEQSAKAKSADGEIVVTARRRDESLQDVPQTINVVSSDTLQQLRINNASDLSQVVPGIRIEGSSAGSDNFGASSSIRGVPTFLLSNASPVVQFYLNDAPTGRGPEASQSLFDIGQIEVLKGPQGTLRGRSAPTGAITITSQTPDLNDVGGFVNLSGTTLGGINAQGAIGLPLIQDVLGIRVAGVVDHTDGNGVTSANFGADPFVKQEAMRGTLYFKPSSNFSATLMYQRLNRNSESYAQLVGPGNGLTGAARNGPVLVAGDRLGITDQPNSSKAKLDFAVAQVEWEFGGQQLSYVGSYRHSVTNSASPQDTANVLPGVEFFQDVENDAKETSHELRLSSIDPVAGMFDYTVGIFYDRETSHSEVLGNARFLTGAFGPPGAPVVGVPLDRYTLRNVIVIDPKVTEKSVFGSVTAHFGPNTEVSVGGRYIDFRRNDRFTLNLLGGFNAINNPTGGFFPCAALGNLSSQLAGAVDSPVYPGRCDLPIPGFQLQNVNRKDKFNPFIYNVAVSHKFSPDFMVFANVGTAFRSAGPAIGFTSVLNCCTQAGGPSLAGLEDLVFHGQEDSRTYEIGFKSTFLDRRVRLNVSVFKQDYDNFFFLTQGTRYLSVTNPAAPATGTVSSAEFTADADAKVKGIDIEAGFQITDQFTLNLGFTWSKAQLANALIPCNDGNFDGTVDTIIPTAQGFVDAGVMVARCQSSESISRTPRWNLTLQPQYTASLTPGMDGFMRGSFSYYPKNPNASEGTTIDDYSLLNVFTGVRSPDGAWEVSLFANNLLNTQQVLSVNSVAPVSSAGVGNVFGRPASGYNQIGYTPRREFGLSVRFAFGSR